MIHKSALIGANCFIGHNVVIDDNVFIGANCFIGHNVVIRSNTRIGRDSTVGHLCVIERNTRIGSFTTFQSQCHITGNATIGDKCYFGPAVVCINERRIAKNRPKIYSGLKGPTIGNKCRIGARALLMPGITIGDNAVVGAGGVYLKDIGDNEVWISKNAEGVFIREITSEEAHYAIQTS